MASLEEEKLIQMVIDYIEFGPNRPISPYPSDPSNFLKLSSPTLQDVLGMVTDCETQILEKLLSYSKGANEIDDINLNFKDRILWGLKMDGFEVSLCRTSWVAAFGCPSVFEFASDYEYIDVMMKNNNDNKEDHDVPLRLIIDIDFRSQFEIARPTQTYMELLNSLPRIFVGTEEKIMKVISLICWAAKVSLRERGLHIPPWRKASYMQSKWLSKNCKRISSSSIEFSNKYYEKLLY